MLSVQLSGPRYLSYTAEDFPIVIASFGFGIFAIGVATAANLQASQILEHNSILPTPDVSRVVTLSPT